MLLEASVESGSYNHEVHTRALDLDEHGGSTRLRDISGHHIGPLPDAPNRTIHAAKRSRTDDRTKTQSPPPTQAKTNGRRGEREERAQSKGEETKIRSQQTSNRIRALHDRPNWGDLTGSLGQCPVMTPRHSSGFSHTIKHEPFRPKGWPVIGRGHQPALYLGLDPLTKFSWNKGCWT